jgi:hypothetical protein
VGDELFDGVAVHADEAALLELLLQHLGNRCVELSVEEQYAVTLVLSGLDVRVLVVLVGGVEIYQVAVLIFWAASMRVLYSSKVKYLPSVSLNREKSFARS